MVLSFESGNEIPKCDHSVKAIEHFLSCDVVYCIICCIESGSCF